MQARTLLSLIARTAAAGFILALAAGAAFVAEAAGKRETALERARTAVEVYQGAMLTETLNDAAALLDDSWAKPIAWHAGAIEAQSWIYAQRGVAGPPREEYYHLSVDDAIRAVDRAPIQPAAWTRIAGLTAAGVKQDRCTVRTCLNYSWRAARMAEDDIACSRLQVAYDNHLLREDDVRIQWVAKSDYWGAVTRRCFSFMRPADMFRALMIAEQDRAIRDARRGIAPPPGADLRPRTPEN